MSKRRTHKSGSCLLIISLLIVIAGLGLFMMMGIPILAQSVFGPPSSSLTIGQKVQYSGQILLSRDQLEKPVANTAPEVEFSIELGEPINSIAIRLENAGFIPDAAAFRNYLIYKGYDTDIKAGSHMLSAASTPIQIAQQILNVYSDTVTFDILPGWRAEEIAAALPTSGIDVSPEQFLAIVRDPSQIGLGEYLPAGASLEGFLFPGEYKIKRDITPDQLALTFVQRFQSQVGPEIRQQIDSHGLTFYQGIILASIVQRETYADAERPTIASVFYNRMAAGAKLETDPTVQYALGYGAGWGNWWKSPLTADDLAINSPYNTYIISGLPPAPISNPDLSSIQSVASPATTDYYYFRAKCDGSGEHVFARTFAEHVANECK